jgi:hypothetical protein
VHLAASHFGTEEHIRAAFAHTLAINKNVFLQRLAHKAVAVNIKPGFACGRAAKVLARADSSLDAMSTEAQPVSSTAVIRAAAVQIFTTFSSDALTKIYILTDYSFVMMINDK